MVFIPASHTEHRSLYHYQPFREESKGYLQATLRDRIIYLPSPDNFNDPWDCRPWFDLTVLDDPAMREAHIQWFMRLSGNPNDARADELRADPRLLHYCVEECSKGIWETLDRQYRLYCLTPKDDNPLMWSHYADKHKGICLQFDVAKAPISLAYKVSYQPTLPFSTVIENGNNPAIKALFTKSSTWDYEEEFRVLAREEAEALANFPITRGNLLKLDDRVLIGIIVGCRAETDTAEEILEMVHRYQPNVAVRKAIRDPHRYGLTIQTIYSGA